MKTLKQLIEAKIERDGEWYGDQLFYEDKTAFKAGAASMLPQLLELAELVEDLAKTDMSQRPPDLLWLNDWRNNAKRLAQAAAINLEKWAAEGNCEGTDNET